MSLHDLAAAGDLEGVRQALQRGEPVDARDPAGLTPLARALAAPAADLTLIRELIAAGADVNAVFAERAERPTPLALAASGGNLARVECLLAAGARADAVYAQGYTPLIHTAYGLFDSPALVPMIRLLLAHGAVADGRTSYGETALGTASRFGRYDAVQALLDGGADPAPLGWTPLLQAIALGSIETLRAAIAAAEPADWQACDALHRTPWLVAAMTGDVERAALVRPHATGVDERGALDETALTLAAAGGRTDLVRWLIAQGADVDAFEQHGETALIRAAEVGHAATVAALLEAGADRTRRNGFDESAIGLAATPEVAELLVAAGADWSDAPTATKRARLGLPPEPTLPIAATVAEYRAGRSRRPGRANPERMDVPFWHAMIRSGTRAYDARQQFGDTGRDDTSVWCFDRFGMSLTPLPDGRFVQIAGEHEDHYDPDFCIYNDVVVHEPDGQFTVYGYPESLFPPTDFHSATYLDGAIYIIGSLGYQDTRRHGQTPVCRLDVATWRIERLSPTGTAPGWISKHRTRIEGPRSLIVAGGERCESNGRRESLVANPSAYRLDLDRLAWSRL